MTNQKHFQPSLPFHNLRQVPPTSCLISDCRLFMSHHFGFLSKKARGFERLAQEFTRRFHDRHDTARVIAIRGFRRHHGLHPSTIRHKLKEWRINEEGGTMIYCFLRVSYDKKRDRQHIDDNDYATDDNVWQGYVPVTINDNDDHSIVVELDNVMKYMEEKVIGEEDFKSFKDVLTGNIDQDAREARHDVSGRNEYVYNQALTIQKRLHITCLHPYTGEVMVSTAGHDREQNPLSAYFRDIEGDTHGEDRAIKMLTSIDAESGRIFRLESAFDWD